VRQLKSYMCCNKLVCQGQGVCTEVPLPAGTVCGASDDCTKSICNSIGQCTATAKADNTPCDVNSTYECASRVCIKGTCNSVHVTDGTVCGKDKCGVRECALGVCTPGPGYKQCPAKDSCHDTGVCDPTTGNCSNPLQPDGQSCPIPSQSSCQIWTCTNGICNASCVISLPFCGNEIVEMDEDCDSNNNTCCVACNFLPEGSACASDNKKCTKDICNSTGVCQHNRIQGCSVAAKLHSPGMLPLFIALGISLFIIGVI